MTHPHYGDLPECNGSGVLHCTCWADCGACEIDGELCPGCAACMEPDFDYERDEEATP